MMTFLPYPDFEESAYALDPMRLGKQRVDTYKIMQSLFGVRMTTERREFTGAFEERNGVEEAIFTSVPLDKGDWTIEYVEKPDWSGHPTVEMWRGHAWSLLKYQKACCDEWTTNLDNKDTLWDKTLWLYFQAYRGEDDNGDPDWLGDEKIHLSHQSNLIRMNPDYYTKYFKGVQPDLPYIWPTIRSTIQKEEAL